MTENQPTISEFSALPSCSVIASAQTWMEGEALRQLEATAQLPGMCQVVGMPDLHPGKNAPIGAAYLNSGQIYPHLVGNDIGCGMALWATGLSVRKKKLERWQKKLQGLDSPWEGDALAWRKQWGLEAEGLADFDASLGTIGGGNHFAELQAIEQVMLPEGLAAAGLDKTQLLLLVHSGSRGLGEAILRAHVAEHGATGLPASSEAAARYLQAHHLAQQWAEANRSLIALRFLDCLGESLPAAPVLEVCHNAVWQRPEGWLHRKGAAPADQGLIVIPGSRGSLSYLVKPLPSARSLWSLAHGAGRKWRRADSKQRLQGRYSLQDLQKTSLGSWVICENKHLLFEEAPEAYKPIDSVVGSLVEAGLLEVVASLRPLITYKTRRSA